MQITFWGAVQQVTGSMHLVEAGKERLLLDCGLTLGRDARERNRRFPFAPSSISAVVISHAHIDHCGNLPNLVRQGFDGPIYLTPATKALLHIMLADSARIQEDEAWVSRVVTCRDEVSTGLLFDRSDVQRTLAQCVPISYDRPVQVRPGVHLRLVNAGHLLGSAMVLVSVDTNAGERRLLYTGDLGRRELGFLTPPAPLPAADLIICESTYGGRTHPALPDLAQRLHAVVQTTIERGGKVLIPAFSLGRAQLVVHYIRQWMDQGLIPRVPIYVDSSLAADIADVFRQFPEGFTPDVQRRDGAEADGVDFDSVHYIRGRQESRDLSQQRGPCILVASGGMCEAGRIVQHLEHNLDDPRNSVLLVSYQAPGSLGHKLLERGPHVHFRGRRWNKWDDIVDVNGFSGHADQSDLLAYFAPHIDRQPTIRLVHGDTQQAEALADALRDRGLHDVDIPFRGEVASVA